jgi:hypothetical protein
MSKAKKAPVIAEAIVEVKPEPVVVGPSCATCKHFAKREMDKGLCRRYPPSQPTNTLTTEGRILTHPLVLASDICGEYAPV